MRPQRERAAVAPPPSRDERAGLDYQATRTPNWNCRGSPEPLCTVPSKLKTRLVVSGFLMFLELKRLKPSTDGSIVRKPHWKSLEIRKSSDEYWLFLRPRLRCVTVPSGLIRSCGVFVGTPAAVTSCG